MAHKTELQDLTTPNLKSLNATAPTSLEPQPQPPNPLPHHRDHAWTKRKSPWSSSVAPGSGLKWLGCWNEGFKDVGCATNSKTSGRVHFLAPAAPTYIETRSFHLVAKCSCLPSKILITMTLHGRTSIGKSQLSKPNTLNSKR